MDPLGSVGIRWDPLGSVGIRWDPLGSVAGLVGTADTDPFGRVPRSPGCDSQSTRPSTTTRTRHLHLTPGSTSPPSIHLNKHLISASALQRPHPIGSCCRRSISQSAFIPIRLLPLRRLSSVSVILPLAPMQRARRHSSAPKILTR
jgi:hypothetical protein